MSAVERDAICGNLLSERLAPLGLAEVAPRTWIDGTRPPVRRLFELKLFKGATLNACWGFSLDFVPHVSGNRLQWHRSDRTARLDVIIDPRPQPDPCYLYEADRFRDELLALLPGAVAAADRDWTRGATYDGMLGIVREIRELRTNCFAFDNYTQLPLALMFLAAKVGDSALAEREMEAYLRGSRLAEREGDRLRQLVRACGPS